jgi:hypothetical protein
VFDPQQMPIQPVERTAASDTAATTNSWYWLLRVPSIDSGKLRHDVGYFFWGRHTGLLPYTPFALLSVVLFLLHGRRSVVRWVALASLVGIAVFFLLWIPFNWHGGGGFVGNRYFVNVYPAFLFLVTSVRPPWATFLGFAFGGLFLGPIVFTPFGAPVPEPTLQAHVRNPAFRLLPLEVTFLSRLPGYEGAATSGVWIQGRKDVFEPKDDQFWIHGATPVELWVFSAQPISGAVHLQVSNWAPGNKVEIDMNGSEAVLHFAKDPSVGREVRRVELRPGPPSLSVKDGNGKILHAYRLFIRSKTGFIPNAESNAARKYPVNDFYLGAGLAFLGTDEELARDVFHLEWDDPEIPQLVTAGHPFQITTRLRNTSSERWPAIGHTRVNLSYHWLDEEGSAVIWEGRRTKLPQDLGAGRSVEVSQRVVAPPEPGRYVLELDLVREGVSWFSQQPSADTLRRAVEVRAAEEPASTADTPAP